MAADQRRVSNAVDGSAPLSKQPPNIGSLRHNAFQWRNLYHHRYGIATYPPPVPRNPSTTTGTYPNVDAYMTLREQEANSNNATRKSVVSSVLDAVGSSSRNAAMNRSGSVGGSHDGSHHHDRSNSDGLPQNLRQQARNALFTRSSFLIQRKAQLLLNKKREVEELRKQNPHALEQVILSIHQRAWTLLIDDSVTKATALEAKDYGDAARDMKERLQEQMRRNVLAMGGDSPFALDGPDDRRSHSVRRSGQEGGVSPTSLERRNSPGCLRHGDHALPSGSTNPIHHSIAAERDRRLNLLSEFAPFFAVISPPTVVSSMHSQATPVYGRYALPTPGGSGDTVGLPLFSQYNTWEEACRQREAWPRAPFHFYLSRDVSFHHSNVTAAVLMLETVAKFIHRHRCIHPPQEQPDDPLRRRGTQLGRSKSTVGITIGDASAPPSSSNLNVNLPSAAAGGGGDQATAPPQPEFWDGHRRIAPDQKCSTLFNPSSCPYLAMEQLTEDIIVVFEHAGARNALPMALSMIRLFLDKALRPGLSQQLFGKTALLDVYYNDTKDHDDLSGSGSSGDEVGGGGPGHMRMRGGAPFGASGSHAATTAFGPGGGVPPALAHLLAPLPPRSKAVHSANSVQRSSLFGNQPQQSVPINPAQLPPPRRPLDESSSSSSDDEDGDVGSGGGKQSVGGSSLFSEREFHALFTLSMWFLDSATATAAIVPVRPAAVTTNNIAGSRKKSRSTQPQAPKMAPGYTRIQNIARAPTLGIAEAVVRFEAARKLRIKAIRRRERQLHEEAQQRALQYREELEKERLREQDEIRRRQIASMQHVHNQHHQKSPNHSGGPMSSKENSFKGSSMGNSVLGGFSTRSHTAAPPHHASSHNSSNSNSTSLKANGGAGGTGSSETTTLNTNTGAGGSSDAPAATVKRLIVPPPAVDSDEDVDVDFFVDVSKRSSKFGPMIQSATLGDTLTATTPKTSVAPHDSESPSTQFLAAPGTSGGARGGQRHTLLPATSGGSIIGGARTTSPLADIPVPTITHLAPPVAEHLPPSAEESAASIRKLVASLRSVVDEDMPVAATKLATPLIMISSYMKLHGVGWCRDVCRSLLDYLSYPDIFLYVTDDDLIQPPLSVTATDSTTSSSRGQPPPSQRFTGAQRAPMVGHKSPSNDPLGQPRASTTNSTLMLPPPALRRNSELGGGGDQLTPVAQGSQARRASSYFNSMGPVVFSRVGSVATEANQSPRHDIAGVVGDPQEASSSRLSISMLGSHISPRAQPPQQWKFPVEDEAVETPSGAQKNLSVTTTDLTSITTAELSLKAPPLDASASTPTPRSLQQGLPFSPEGLDPALTTFLNTMLRKETTIAEHIQKSLEIWFEALEGSHASQKLPSGIAYLLTAMCASVHSHLLSGVVMTSALDVDGIEPDSIEFVEHLISSLVASTSSNTAAAAATSATAQGSTSQPSSGSPHLPAIDAQQRRSSVAAVEGGIKRPAPPSSGLATATPSARRRATVILDPQDIAQEQEPSPGLVLVPPTPAAPSGSHQQSPDESLPEPPKTESAAPAADATNGTISLVSDVQSYRLAKFILFDVWLLPMLNNAQRYGLIPPHAPPHLVNNINAFVRYAKILVNAPYTQRDDERKKYKQQQEKQAASLVAAAAAAISGGPIAPSAAEVPQTIDDIDDFVPPEYNAVLRRSAIPGVISGVYNSTNGSLVQLFRFPQDFLRTNDSLMNGAGSGLDERGRKKSPLHATTPSNSRRRPSNTLQLGSASRRNMSRVASTASARLGIAGDGASMRKNGAGRISSAAILATSLNSAAAVDYYVPQNGTTVFPGMPQLSPQLQQLNVAIGVASASQMAPSCAPSQPLAPGSHAPAGKRVGGSSLAPPSVTQQLEMFCWHASTDEDRHRVVPEFQVPPHIAVTCTENIYKVITGQHPATKVLCRLSNAAATNKTAFGRSPGPSNVSPDTTPLAPRLSVVSASSDGLSGGGDGGAAKKKDKGEGEPSKDAVDLYLRCLHSVLLHPTTAGQALDCMSVNHRKLFQQLMRVPTASASTSAGSGISLSSDATSLACSLYPYLLVGVRDQPLVDGNAVAMLTSASLVTQNVPLPSSFIQARRRLLARQLFLTTGARIGNTIHTSSNADDPSGDSPVHPTSPTRTSRRRSSHSISIGQPDTRSRGLEDDPEDGPIPQPLFAAWWCYMAAALCAKAECALEESSAFLSKRWERQCRKTMRRYSHRDSVAEATFSVMGSNAKTARGGKGGASSTKTAKEKKVVQLLSVLTSAGNKKKNDGGAGDAASVASGGGLLAPTSRFGGDASLDAPNTARRLSTTSTVVVRSKSGGASGINNPLMQRWREAVTDSVDRGEDRAGDLSNSNSSRPSRAPSVSLETPRVAPRAPQRHR
jgi:hypothetical protein